MPKPYGTALLRLRCRSPNPGVSLLKQEVGGAYELLLFRMDKRNLCHGTRPLLTQFRVSASRSPDPLQARHSREGPQEQTFELYRDTERNRCQVQGRRRHLKARHDQDELQRMICNVEMCERKLSRCAP